MCSHYLGLSWKLVWMLFIRPGRKQAPSSMYYVPLQLGVKAHPPTFRFRGRQLVYRQECVRHPRITRKIVVFIPGLVCFAWIGWWNGNSYKFCLGPQRQFWSWRWSSDGLPVWSMRWVLFGWRYTSPTRAETIWKIDFLLIYRVRWPLILKVFVELSSLHWYIWNDSAFVKWYNWY